MNDTRKIYVALLREGTDVWRPVEAEPIEGDAFRITSEASNPEDVWQFLPGELVPCEEHEFAEQGAAVVAAEKAQIPGHKQPFLVVYDYGQGGRWAFLRATSADEIHRRYSELEVFTRVPDWMRALMLHAVRVEDYDIDQPPTGLLASLLEARTSR